MRERHHLLGGGKQDAVFSDQPAGPQHGEADFAGWALTGDAVAPAPLDGCEETPRPPAAASPSINAVPDGASIFLL